MYRFPVIIAAFAAIIIFGCSKSPRCWGKDKDKGEIIDAIDQQEIPPNIREYFENSKNTCIRSIADLITIADSCTKNAKGCDK